jgi:hypothetical protein
MTPPIANITCNILPGNPARLTPWGCLVQQAIAHERTWQTICPCPAGDNVRQEHPEKWEAAKGKSIHYRHGGWGGIPNQIPISQMDPETREKIKVLKESNMEASEALREAELNQVTVKYCKHHPTVPQHKNTGLCLQCLQERARKSSELKKEKQESQPPQTEPEKVAPTAAPQPEDWSFNQKINFQSKHREIFDFIVAEADRQERTIPAQIIYMLKQAMIHV